MAGRIFFLGGIHGVGKGTLCRRLEDISGVKSVSASSLIRAYRPSDDGQKRVADIGANQSAFLDALEDYRRQQSGDAVVDGHFVLFDKNGDVQEIEDEVFGAMDLDRFLLMVDQTETIHARLLARDGHAPGQEQLGRMADLERQRAEGLSRKLGKPLKTIYPGTDVGDVLDFLGLD